MEHPSACIITGTQIAAAGCCRLKLNRIVDGQSPSGLEWCSIYETTTRTCSQNTRPLPWGCYSILFLFKFVLIFALYVPAYLAFPTVIPHFSPGTL